MSNRITLRQLISGLQSLPDEQKDKPLAYLDISYINEEELKELIEHLAATKETEIRVCAN